MNECLYDLEFDDHGNIRDIQFNAEKIGDDKIIFDAIAPVVQNGSYITMKGENGYRWEFQFKRGKCKERSL